MRLSLTDGMIAADFLGDPTVLGLDMPSQTDREWRTDSSAGRLWTMCCTSSISIVAQSLCMAVILPPEMRHSSWTSPKRTVGLRDAARDGVRDAAGGLRDPFDRIDGLSGIRAGRFEEPGMCSVGSGMVLAIGDLAGATFVTLLAATATQFARAVAYGPYARSRSNCVRLGWSGMASP